MVLTIMLTLLVIKTDFSYAIVKLNEIQSIELVDKGRNNGGILTITLKGDKEEQIVYGEDNTDKWNEVKAWLETNTMNLSSEMSKRNRISDFKPRL
jgi:hypothetical protein